MSLYKQWTDMVVDYVQTKGEKAFWEEYSAVEEKIYTRILSNHGEKPTFTISALAEEIGTTNEFIMGFLDGINESLKGTLDLESMDESSEVTLDIDLEKLFFNMLDAKAEYLYGLSQWDAIFSEEKRKAIKKEYQTSKTVRNEVRIGRNDPCP